MKGTIRNLSVCAAALLFILTFGGGPAVAGLDDDGNPDVVFANVNTPNSLACLGTGNAPPDPLFTCSDLNIGNAGGSQDVAVGDVNNDGKLDAVFAASFDQPSQVCLGDGLGGLDCSDISTNPADLLGPRGVALGKINGDDFLDAIFVTRSGFINRVCLWDESLDGFICANMIDDPNEPKGFDSNAVALGDVDGNGTLDAVVANFAKPPLFNAPDKNLICLGNGLGGFTCSPISADEKNSFDVALEDLDGDNRLDAVFANLSVPNTVCIQQPTIPITFACSNVSGDTNVSWGVALGKVDGNDTLDVVFANATGPNRVCFGNGSGGFSGCQNVGVDSNSSLGVALGDVDGDGKLDAVFANGIPAQKNRLCLGDGLGGFDCENVSDDESTSFGVAIAPVKENGGGGGAGDADGDGIADGIDGTFNGGFTDESGAVSDNFTDQNLAGTSFGEIIFRSSPDAVTVEDEPNPAGLRIRSTGFAAVRVCSRFWPVFLRTGGEIVVTCASLTLEVVTGPAEVQLGGDENNLVTVPTGGAARITETAEGQFQIENLSEAESITVTIGGQTTSVPPGATSAGCDCSAPGAIVGSDRPNFLIGTRGDDLICGLGGNDYILGRGGNDCIDAGAGKDIVLGGKGEDLILGREGRDVLLGGRGNDTILGGGDSDKLLGSSGNDALDGGEGFDFLFGGGGLDECTNGERIFRCEQ